MAVRQEPGRQEALAGHVDEVAPPAEPIVAPRASAPAETAGTTDGAPHDGVPAQAPASPAGPPSYPWDRFLRWFDRVQAGWKPLSFPFAVLKKGGEDQVSLLAAVMSHFGMLSVFPLLLLVATLAGFIFRDDAKAQQDIIDAALNNFPVLGDYLKASIQSLPGSGSAVIFGAILLLWASLGFTKAAQIAMADVWGVPRRLRPGFWQQLGRSVWALAMLGLPTLLTATLTLVTSSTDPTSTMNGLPQWFQTAITATTVVLGLAVFLTINFTSHLLCFRALTPRTVSIRRLVPGTILFTLFWTALTAFGSALIASRLARANQLYGTIGFIIGLIFWIYLGAYGALLTAELNSVWAKRLFPRTLFSPPKSDIDREALRARARTEEIVPGEVVEVRFDDPWAPAPPGGDGKDDGASKERQR